MALARRPRPIFPQLADRRPTGGPAANRVGRFLSAQPGRGAGALRRIATRTVIEMTLLPNNPRREGDEESALDRNGGTTDLAQAGAPSERLAPRNRKAQAPIVAPVPTESDSADPEGSTAILGLETSPEE